LRVARAGAVDAVVVDAVAVAVEVLELVAALTVTQTLGVCMYTLLFWIGQPYSFPPFLSDSDKKIHQGWGGDEAGTELNAEVAGAADAVAATQDTAAADDGWGAAADWADGSADAPAAPGDESAAPAADGAKGGERERKPRYQEEEEEDNTLTLEQYLAKQKETQSEVLPAKLEARKVDDSEIKGTVIDKTAQEDAYFAGKVRRSCNHLRITLLIFSCRPRLLLRLVLRRSRRSSSKSMLASSVLPVVVVAVVADSKVAVVDSRVAAVVKVVGVGAERAVVVAVARVVVASVEVAMVPTARAQLSKLTMNPPSHPLPKLFWPTQK
jgi:hypothetical protein